MRNAWMLKYSLKFTGETFPDGVFLTRDLTKEDRATEKANYLQRKQQKNVAGRNPENDVTDVSREEQTDSASASTGNQTSPQGEGESNGT